MKKKILSFMLAVVMVIGIMPVMNANAEVTASGICGDNLIWVLDDEGTLTISGEGEMWDYSWDGSASWNKYREGIKKLVIEDGVKSIGKYAFHHFSTMDCVVIGNDVAEIGAEAFYCCSNLKDVTIPNCVENIEHDVFLECRSLEGITVESENKYYSSDKYGVLFNKDKTELIQYPVADSNTTYKIPSGVKTIKRCAFAYGNNLKNVVISDTVSEINYGAFMGCDRLSDMVLPDKVTTIAENAFAWCCDLEEVSIGAGLINIDETSFAKCNKLERFKVSQENSVYACDNQGVLYNKTKTKIIRYPLGKKEQSYETNLGVDTIGEYAFYDCKNLINISLTDDVKTIENNAFELCSGLESVNLGKGVTQIGENAFSYCGSITSLEMSESIKTIGAGAFEACKKLGIIKFNSGLISIGDGAFLECHKLKHIEIPGSVEDIGKGTFSNCKSLEEITVSEGNGHYSVDEYGVLFDINKNELIQYPAGNDRAEYMIPSGVTEIRDQAFAGASNLTGIEMPNEVKYVGTGSFAGCVNLENIAIPESVLFVGEGAFSNCVQLEDVTIPKGLNCINRFVFVMCNGLKKVSMSSGVTMIENDAFDGCDSLSDVYYDGTMTKWKQVSVGTGNEPLETATIHCKDGEVVNGVEVPSAEGPAELPTENPTETVSIDVKSAEIESGEISVSLTIDDIERLNKNIWVYLAEKEKRGNLVRISKVEIGENGEYNLGFQGYDYEKNYILYVWTENMKPLFARQSPVS